MFKDLLARFKKVLTVAEWKKEAQGAIEQKEFVIASLAELHRVEKAESALAQERTMQRQPMSQGRAPMQAMSSQYGQPTMQHSAPQPMQQMSSPMNAYGRRNEIEEREKSRKKSELSLADLMNQIKQQQQIS